MLFHFTFQMADRCIICDLTFSSSENLRRHMNTIHPKTVQCPYCEYTSTRSFNIRRHLKQAHEIENTEDMIEPAKRPRIDQTCSICHNYTTNDTSNMKRHMKGCTIRNKPRKVNKGGDASEDDHGRTICHEILIRNGQESWHPVHAKLIICVNQEPCMYRVVG